MAEKASFPTKPRSWYSCDGFLDNAGRTLTPFKPRGVVQFHPADYRRVGFKLTLPEHVLRLAQAEYERQYHNGQDYERMQERGGLELMEVVALLADYVDRLGGKPTEQRG